MKFCCPHCSQRVECGSDAIGAVFDCPNCNCSVTVPRLLPPSQLITPIEEPADSDAADKIPYPKRHFNLPKGIVHTPGGDSLSERNFQNSNRSSSLITKRIIYCLLAVCVALPLYLFFRPKKTLEIKYWYTIDKVGDTQLDERAQKENLVFVAVSSRFAGEVPWIQALGSNSRNGPNSKDVILLHPDHFELLSQGEIAEGLYFSHPENMQGLGKFLGGQVRGYRDVTVPEVCFLIGRQSLSGSMRIRFGFDDKISAELLESLKKTK